MTRTAAAKARLLALLEAGLPYWPAMALLDGWGVEDEDVRAKMAEIVAGPPARSAAFAHLFPRVIGDQAECRRRLLAILGDIGCRRPDLALEGLRTLGGPQPDTEAVDAVLKNNPARPDVLWMDRDHCMIVLIRGFHADPRVREIARQQFAAEFPPYTAVAASFPDDREMRAMLIERLTPLPDRLRLVLAERLPRECPEAAFALGRLGLYDREQDEQVKCQASLSYWGMVKAAGPVGEAHLERLGRDILRYGPDLEEQRQAAFCGLATLGRLDIMASARETIGEERICAIGTLRRMGQRNGPLVRCVLENWDAVRRTFGDEACSRLNHRHGDWMQMWGHLAPFADAHPAARQNLLRFLSERPERTAGHDILLFLGRTVPGTRLLLEYCLKALHIGEDGADVGGPLALVAAELLGANFRGNPEVLDTILSGRARQYLYEKTILCLCEGWDRTEAMGRAYEAVTRDERRELMHVTWHRLLCRKGDADVVASELLSLLNSGGSPPGLSGPLVVRPFVRRIAEDEPLAGLLHQHLLGAPTCSEKASLPRLLVGGRGLGDDLRSWCLAELGRQLEARSPELGFDWVAGRVRAVSQSLLDVLEPGVAEEGVLPV